MEPRKHTKESKRKSSCVMIAVCRSDREKGVECIFVLRLCQVPICGSNETKWRTPKIHCVLK
jgi:hypothetical protein